MLFSRSGAPDRAAWESVLAADEDWRAVRTVRTLLEAERRGARIVVRAVDGETAALRAAVTEVQESAGRIDGLVHAAGVPGQNMISLREPEDFHRVLAPKMHAARLLEAALPSLDFIVYFSSVAVVFPSSGQGDYAAANHYFDTLARAARTDGTHVVSIDRVAWRDTGMAADHGSKLDTTFKALPTATGIGILDRMLRSR